MNDLSAGEAAPSSTAADTVDDSARVVDGVDVDAVVAAVIACPSVSGMSDETFGAATLLPGRRVAGVRVDGSEVRLQLRARWGITQAMLMREIRAATAALIAGHRLHVVIDDIDLPDDNDPVVTHRRLSGRPAQGEPSA